MYIIDIADNMSWIHGYDICHVHIQTVCIRSILSIWRSGFDARVRSNKEIQDKDAAWNALQICEEPTDPNFHQVASVLAYGPLALGKGQHCPRDGRLDCSIVDALEATSCLG